MRTPSLFAAVFVALQLGSYSSAKPSEPTPASIVANVVEAAENLLDSLDESQQEQILYDFDDKEQRERWSNLPTSMVKRGGIPWADLDDTQQQALLQLIKTTLSEAGYRQVIENVDGDEYLREHGGRADFGWHEFYISLLGKPSTSEPWMWQFGGHHLAINATIVGDRITLAPTLTGGQPMEYQVDGNQVRQMAEEQDQAFELIGSLTPEQLRQTVLADRHTKMIFGPGKDGVKPKQEGISASALNESQRKLLLQLIGSRVRMLNDVHAKLRMNRIENDLGDTWFAWFGPTTPGSAATYRIQGPTVLIEYAPQRMGKDATDHVHAMYRDPTNDYGAGLIAKEP